MDGNLDSILDGNSFIVKNIFMPYGSILNNEMELVHLFEAMFQKNRLDNHKVFQQTDLFYRSHITMIETLHLIRARGLEIAWCNCHKFLHRILNKKEAFISGRFFRLCGSSLIVLFDDIHFSPIFLKVKSMKTVQMLFEDCAAPS